MSNEKLFEWYEGVGPNPTMISADSNRMKDKEESAEKKVDKLEKGAEMHKLSALAKALDNKLMLLSGVFSGYSEPERRKELKAEVKEIAKRIHELVNDI